MPLTQSKADNFLLNITKDFEVRVKHLVSQVYEERKQEAMRALAEDLDKKKAEFVASLSLRYLDIVSRTDAAGSTLRIEFVMPEVKQ